MNTSNMKNLYKAFIGISIMGLLIINSCSPEDVVVEDLAIKLTNGSWTFSSAIGEDNPTTDWYTALYKNDLIKFNDDGTCTNDQLAEKGTGTWSLNSNQTVLTLKINFPSGDTRNETWNIKTISSSQLVYTFDIAPNTLEMIYTH